MTISKEPTETYFKDLCVIVCLLNGNLHNDLDLKMGFISYISVAFLVKFYCLLINLPEKGQMNDLINNKIHTKKTKIIYQAVIYQILLSFQ